VAAAVPGLRSKGRIASSLWPEARCMYRIVVDVAGQLLDHLRHRAPHGEVGAEGSCEDGVRASRTGLGAPP
jgi:hypothetical protein